MPDSTEHERINAALEEAQERTCGLCVSFPRAPGDHLCRRCRKRLNDARDAYEAAKKDVEKKDGTR